MSADLLFQHLQARNLAAALALAQAQPGLLGERNAQGQSPLALATYLGLNEFVQQLRPLAPPLTFHDACLLGDAARVEALLPGADLNAFAPDGFTGIALAAFFGHTQLALRLLEAGADPNLRAANAQQVNALHAAVARADVPLVEALLRAGADANLAQQGGVTPWMGAASRGSRALLGLLLLFGADPQARDAQGRAAPVLARDHGQAELADWLEQRFSAQAR
jgi:uncharacterized protein